MLSEQLFGQWTGLVQCFFFFHPYQNFPNAGQNTIHDHTYSRIWYYILNSYNCRSVHLISHISSVTAIHFKVCGQVDWPGWFGVSSVPESFSQAGSLPLSSFYWSSSVRNLTCFLCSTLAASLFFSPPVLPCGVPQYRMTCYFIEHELIISVVMTVLGWFFTLYSTLLLKTSRERTIPN